MSVPEILAAIECLHEPSSTQQARTQADVRSPHVVFELFECCFRSIFNLSFLKAKLTTAHITFCNPTSQLKWAVIVSALLAESNSCTGAILRMPFNWRKGKFPSFSTHVLTRTNSTNEHGDWCQTRASNCLLSQLHILLYVIVIFLAFPASFAHRALTCCRSRCLQTSCSRSSWASSADCCLLYAPYLHLCLSTQLGSGDSLISLCLDGCNFIRMSSPSFNKRMPWIRMEPWHTNFVSSTCTKYVPCLLFVFNLHTHNLH